MSTLLWSERPPTPHTPQKRFLKINFESLIFFWGGGWEFVACEQQTHFRSSLLSLLAEAREATTGNASAVRRLEGLLFRFIVSKLGSRVPVSQRLIFTPSPPKNPQVTPSGNVCFTFFFFFHTLFPSSSLFHSIVSICRLYTFWMWMNSARSRIRK